MLYSLIRPWLFRLDPETAHQLALASLDTLDKARLAGAFRASPLDAPQEVMGLRFPNPVGLAAGFDKNGEHIDGLAALGFGFLEIGTVTPRPQPGQPRPRLFRVPEAEVLINRMGFNNDGVEALLANVARSRFSGILGINIGKNFDTPLSDAVEDYLKCLRAVYARASYIAVNISSPNTRNLRELQGEEPLERLLRELKREQTKLADATGRYVPLVLKVAPDLEREQIESIARLLIAHRIDGLIATNTTLSRDSVGHLPVAAEAGGLSGRPLSARSTRVIAEFARCLGGALPIIGVGGVMAPEDAVEKLRAGASLIQLYTGFVYRGPKLIGSVVEALRGA